ncbi:hypothetical protein GQX73_g3806 [Xylaria multiplex]|uniref:Uncharacterized protein n=1 Tax=Xylaria multiplex TaxID=323545 RepID=A0A7C8MRM5_9PEZI|nr:hypothetical protein GQX73_g3806 [Xylaria multiplex]
MEPIAIIGFALKLPQEVEDEFSFWDVLKDRQNLMTEWSESRGTIDSFHDTGSGKLNTLRSRGAHFVKEDPGVFDAPFFSITSNEAIAMDPQQRWVLEAAYHAFENSGTPLERLKGSSTAVFGASMSGDYARILSKDPDSMPRMAATGLGSSCLPNRVSWFFDLRGPSVLVDTACSGSLIALDHACQSIHNGDASAALVFGSSLLLSPESSIILSNMNFLSPDSVCYSFDRRANGYARGEGVVAIVIKPLHQALSDGDMIRAIIRSTGNNQDGRTPGLTQPSAEAQEMLIRHVYQKAGLDFKHTRYVEAHGTGTPTGDPVEMRAIGRVFRNFRSPQDPLYVGSVKANIGHLEGGSGLAGLLKATLLLEKATIPPNALFEEMNPSIDAEFYHVSVPTESVEWPSSGLRRASVNSFSFGGSNAHAILDDAQHYLQGHGLKGFHNSEVHCSEKGPYNMSLIESQASDLSGKRNGNENDASGDYKLLVWTAADGSAMERVLDSYQTYYQTRVHGDADKLNRLAHTLAVRRSHLAWRSFAVIGMSPSVTPMLNGSQLAQLPAAKPVRASNEGLSMAFVFTGQGAQYPGMGVDLLRYSIFAETLQRAETAFRKFGCDWSLFDQLREKVPLDEPKYAQPICTALQLALVELLKSFGVFPATVVGHSSGEIAAAYTTGALSFESACKVAYYRGLVTMRLKEIPDLAPGAMLSVNLPEAKVQDYVGNVEGIDSSSTHVACINSPSNCTLSATEETIDKIKTELDRDEIFSQKLRTGVAYHSPVMHRIANEYLELLGSLDAGISEDRISMISTVPGYATITPEDLLNGQYWVDNLVSPVQFAAAIQLLARATPKIGQEALTDVIEIGPHPALRRPILDTLATTISSIRYQAVLHRSQPSVFTALSLIGGLFCRGYSVSVARGNNHDIGTIIAPLIDCPKYPFDHSRRYWAESRISKGYRLRPKSAGELLGQQANDWNTLRPSFRNRLSVETIPWLGDHVISNTTICPGAAMLIMALEAVSHLGLSTAGKQRIAGFLIKEANFLSPITVAEEAQAATETCLYLRPLKAPDQKRSASSEVAIFSYNDDQWTECFKAHIQIQYQENDALPVDGGRETRLETERIASLCREAAESSAAPIDSVAFYDFLRDSGMAYGPAFRLLQEIRWDTRKVSTARINKPLVLHHGDDSPVHPTVLDAAVHLILAQISRGGSTPTPTLVPQRLSNAWISSHAWFESIGPVYLTSILHEQDTRGVKGSLYATTEDNLPLCVIDHMVMTSVSRGDARVELDEEERTLVYEIEWKPQLSGLDPVDLKDLCDKRIRLREDNFKEDRIGLESLMRQAARHAIMTLSNEKDESPNLSPHLQRLVGILRNCATEENDSDWAGFQGLLDQYEAVYPSHRLLTSISRNLPDIIRGDIDALELHFASDAAEDFYNSSFANICDVRLQTFLDLLTHETPSLRILEVGAGTGGMSQCILGALKQYEQRTGCCRFSDEFEDRLVFKTLDLECEPDTQGFEPGAYDLVIAGSVLHATSQLAATLARVRALLRPGGYLINAEITVPDAVWANVVFGSLPGWWLSTETWRQHGPLITEDKWRMLSCAAGFSGHDLLLHKGDISVMVSRAIETQINAFPAQYRELYRLIVIIDSNQEDQRTLAAELGKGRHDVDVVSFEDIKYRRLIENEVMVSLLEVGAPKLSSLERDDFLGLQMLVQKTQNLLWVAAPATGTSDGGGSIPHYATAMGLLRVIQSEEPTKRIASLVVESPDAYGAMTEKPLGLVAKCIGRVIETCFESTSHSPEVEFTIRDGHLSIARMVHSMQLEEDRRLRVQPRLLSGSWSPGPALALEVGVPGMLDTLRFVEDERFTHRGDHKSTPGLEEVEIEAKAWPISFRDVFIALGRLGQEGLGFECAGIVTRAGAAANFQPGERVCMVVPGCMRTYPRAAAECVFRIPDSLSFHDAVAAINPGMTAYQALVNIAGLKRGEKVLIHSGAGSTGQMAIWLAKQIGAEIFVTVGYEEKKNLLMKLFGIPATHIFYSRNQSFAQGIMRETGGRGVDVILNSLSGDKLVASWECIAPYGRFVEIGKMDINSNASLPMAYFAKNVSFSAVDIYHISQTDLGLTRQLAQTVIDLIAKGEASCPTPLHRYPVTQIEQAFRYMQSGKNTGRIIIDVDRDHEVTKYIVKKGRWEFDPDASYLIGGGWGGLGRVILQWMASKGAKHFIIPSRSGLSSQAARELARELQSQGVQVIARTCNIASEAELATLLQECADVGLPPIKGCINATMFLQDAIFEGMTYEQWKGTLQSKIDATWNLHQQLPRQLDFFILLSSLSGIYGSLAQGNYAAGCTFQDAVARHRAILGIGKTSISLDLGWMRDAGIVAENDEYRRNRLNARDMNPVDVADMLALLDIYCDPDLPQTRDSQGQSQILLGAVTPMDTRRRGGPAPPFESRPLFAGFAVSAAVADRQTRTQQKSSDDAAALFRQATTDEARVVVVVTALKSRLGRALGIATEDVEDRQCLVDFGVDSLVAIELRNWIRRDFLATVAVFELTGTGTSILALGQLVVERTEHAF